MGWNERSDPDMRTANFCDVYREGVYWDNKALPVPTLTLPDTYFQHCDYFLHFIETKWLSDTIWDLKREKKVR